ncbi:MAG: iron ABC transporter permease [Ktedonobacteraceae bacterium]|nr:iron ABC transporter permease [Ktedonobacteraceae bacterium]
MQQLSARVPSRHKELATLKLLIRTAPVEPQPRRRQARQRGLLAPLILGFFFILLIAVLLLAISAGSTRIPLESIVQILLNGTRIFHFVPRWDASAEVIIWQVRLPLVIGAAVVGAALAVAGVLFQGMLRNPLADPYLIGTSSGASLGAAISFVLPLDTFYGALFPLTPLLAFLGAIATVLFVYAIARSGRRTPVVTLLLAGVVINAVMTAFQTVILTFSPQARFAGQALFNWLSGGIAVTGWPPILLVSGLVLAGSILAFGLSNILDTFALGEEGAATLGLNVEKARFAIVIIASLITAAAVSISGLIGFVGLVIPHAIRLLLGPRHRPLIPASALGGAIFLVLADLLARTVAAPAVLPVGVCTALVGAPFFLYLLRKSKGEYTW